MVSTVTRYGKHAIWQCLSRPYRRYKLSIRLFHNLRPLGVNLMYWRYHRYCQAVSRGTIPTVSGNVRELRQSGALRIVNSFADQTLLRDIATTARNYFDTRQNVVETPGKSRLCYSVDLYDHILELITPQMETIFYQHYKSHFKIFQVQITRYTKDHDVFESQMWHMDDHSHVELKLIIYLHDVHEEDGAFRYIPMKKSDELLLRGFNSWASGTVEERVNERLENAIQFESVLNKNLKIFEGHMGDAILFTPNIIHRAGIPTGRPRDFVTFTVYPSPVHYRAHFQKKRREIWQNIELAFSDNPWDC